MDPEPHNPDGADRPGGASRRRREVDGADAWVAGARVDGAIAERSRAGWRQRAEAAEETLQGVLAGLAEQRAAVVLHTRAGRRHPGTVRGVGIDVVLLSTGGGLLAVPSWSVTAVRPLPPHRGGLPVPAPRATPAVPTDAVTLASVLEGHLGEPVVVALAGDEGLWRGTLTAVGEDVVRLRLEGSAGVAVLALQSFSDALLPTSTG